MRRRDPVTELDPAMPEHLRRFRSEDWPGVDPVSAGVRWTYARAMWRRERGIPAWARRRVVDR